MRCVSLSMWQQKSCIVVCWGLDFYGIKNVVSPLTALENIFRLGAFFSVK
jgi:hypothetical protein